MSVLSREEVQSLVQTANPPCVSIFLPTYRAGSETQQNPIRLKNLLRTAEERLADWGLRAPEAEELLAPARRLVDDGSFWQYQSDGLALFRSPDLFRTYRLPVTFSELSVVEDRFHVKPLFPLLSGDGRFYIVALSLKNIRLIAATRHSAEEVELPDVPRSLTEALGELTRQSSPVQTATNTNARMRTMARSPIFHGHGTAEDDLKAEILQFFNLADKALQKYLDRNCPVVLAGVEYLLPRYKETTEHPHVLDEGLTGNADDLSPEQLRDLAWEIVEPHFQEDRRRAAERYGDLSGTGRASSRAEEILPAAHDGRVDTLFVARGVRLWGSYNGGTRQILLQGEQGNGQEAGYEDLIDLAAVQTFLNGGTVFAVAQQEVPDGQAMAAIFRY